MPFDLPDWVESASALEELNIDDRALILEELKSGEKPVKTDCNAMSAFMKAPRKVLLPEGFVFTGNYFICWKQTGNFLPVDFVNCVF